MLVPPKQPWKELMASPTGNISLPWCLTSHWTLKYFSTVKVMLRWELSTCGWVSLYLYKQGKLETFVTDFFSASFSWLSGHYILYNHIFCIQSGRCELVMYWWCSDCLCKGFLKKYFKISSESFFPLSPLLLSYSFFKAWKFIRRKGSQLWEGAA